MKEIVLHLSRIDVILTQAADKLVLYTDLPPTYPGWLPDEAASLTLECTRDTGADYVRRVFEMEPRIVNGRPYREER